MLGQHVTFADLYDQYRIKKIQVTFYPRAVMEANVGVAIPATAATGYFRTVIDKDDSVTTSMDGLIQYANCKTHSVIPGRPFSRTFIPAVSTLVHASTTSYGVAHNQWLNCSNIDVPHYGLKCAFDANGGVGGTLTLDVEVKMWIEFKNVR